MVENTDLPFVHSLHHAGPYPAQQRRCQTALGIEGFMRLVCKALAQEERILPAAEAKEQGAAVHIDQVDNNRLRGRHFLRPYDTQEREEGAGRKQGTCHVRYAKDSKIETDPKKLKSAHKIFYKCQQCNISLCVYTCFELYHTKEDYTLYFFFFFNFP